MFFTETGGGRHDFAEDLLVHGANVELRGARSRQASRGSVLEKIRELFDLEQNWLLRSYGRRHQ
ncbi:MAG: hypothetical protein R3F65_15740 [bacterium]